VEFIRAPAGDGTSPSTIDERGLTSLETSALDIEALSRERNRARTARRITHMATLRSQRCTQIRFAREIARANTTDFTMRFGIARPQKHRGPLWENDLVRVNRNGMLTPPFESPSFCIATRAIRSGALALAMLSACSPSMPRNASPTPSRPQAAVGFPRAPLFPTRRVVAFYGIPGVPAMGVLGSGTLEGVSERLKRQTQAYARFGRRVTPAFEEIVVAAQSAPGGSALYHGPPDLAHARAYLAVVRKMSGLLVLDIQPGRERFLPLVRRFEKLLREPDVGLALDPEWEMGPREVPGKTIGGTTATEVNAVAAYLAAIVRHDRLPQKLFVIHQFTPDMISHRSDVRALPELATTFHVDGFGGRALKLVQYKKLATRDRRFANGFKLFYQQDVKMFEPSDVMRLTPQPDLITYQ
jgi:hypothetical protein